MNRFAKVVLGLLTTEQQLPYTTWAPQARLVVCSLSSLHDRFCTNKQGILNSARDRREATRTWLIGRALTFQNVFWR